MATFFGIDVQQVVGTAFDGQVQRGTLIRRISRAFNPDNPEDPKQIEQRYPFQGFVDERDVKGRVTAKMVVIFGSSIAVEPKDNDQVEIGSETLTIRKVETDFTRTTFECLTG